MITKTRFEIGDEVVMLHCNRATKCKIQKIVVEADATSTKVLYEFYDGAQQKSYRKDERYCFRDKSELADFINSYAI